MTHMHKRPTRVWVLSDGDHGPRLLTEAELEKVFTRYEDTGFEPKLEWLYETIGCRCVDLRELPGLGHLWFDDEGRLAGRPQNDVASAVYEYCYRSGEGILGMAVLICYENVPEGADQDVLMTAYESIKKARAAQEKVAN